MGFPLNEAPKSEIIEKEVFEMYSVIEVGFGTQIHFFHPGRFWMPFGVYIKDQLDFLPKFVIFGR